MSKEYKIPENIEPKDLVRGIVNASFWYWETIDEIQHAEAIKYLNDIQIDNVNPSEVLEYILNKVFGYGVQSTLDCLVLRGYNTKKMLEQECLGKTLEQDLNEAETKITDLKGIATIKQSLIKAQEQEQENAKYKKAFELIKEKGVDVSIIMSTKTVEEYNGFIQYCNSNLSEAEYNLLKEMFG